MIRLTVRHPGSGRELASHLLNLTQALPRVAAGIITIHAERLGVSPLALDWEVRRA